MSRRDQILKQLVDHYISNYRDGARRQMEAFRNLRMLKVAFQDQLAVAICDAVKVSPDTGKKHDHQWRQDQILPEVETKLQSAKEEIGVAKDFDGLHAIIEATIRPIHGVGELTVYDIAHRIGAFLQLEPKRVYLHAGTAEGARLLGYENRTTLLKKRNCRRRFRR